MTRYGFILPICGALVACPKMQSKTSFTAISAKSTLAELDCDVVVEDGRLKRATVRLLAIQAVRVPTGDTKCKYAIGYPYGVGLHVTIGTVSGSHLCHPSLVSLQPGEQGTWAIETNSALQPDVLEKLRRGEPAFACAVVTEEGPFVAGPWARPLPGLSR